MPINNDKAIRGLITNSLILALVAASMVTALIITVLVLNLGDNRKEPEAIRIAIKPPRKAYVFTLTDQQGVMRSLADWRGRVVIMSFIYTRCPTVCLVVAQQFSEIGEILSELVPERVVLVLISIDPEYDTPERLKEWSEAFNGKWYALTGTLEECKKVWENYGMVVMKDPKTGSTAHRVKTIIIDKEGYVRYEYVGYPSLDQITKDVLELLG